MRSAKTSSIALALTACLAVSLYAQDKPPAALPGSDYVPVQGLENWTYEYDVSAFKPGTYNIMARAVDSAGNSTFATPFNLIVDPASDLPVARIVNPLPSARVGADLNIVGTCVDDDAVGNVEYKLDDGEWGKAEGSGYWSHYVATGSLADGPHRIFVRGVDIHGLTGPEASTVFHLDRTKPLHTVGAPAFGAISSGRVAVSGEVFDANGLAELSYSADSGTTWVPMRHSYDKKTTKAAFSIVLDTKKLPDGPAVIWLRSIDQLGSEGIAVFMYFIDNTAPELAILSPGVGESVNGKFSITGRAYDAVGVASVTWMTDKLSGQVELVPGNPFFSIPVEAPAKAGPLSIRILVTDAAGNVTTQSVSRSVDPAADLPVATLASPTAGSTADGVIRISGGARDDDGVASVAWRMDDGAETSIETSGAFSFAIDSVASGPRNLSVRAVDVNGLAGPWLTVPFTYAGAAPKLALLKATDAQGDKDFKPGVQISTMEGKASLSGTVEAANPLAELAYTINGGAPMKLAFSKTAGGAAFVVPLPPSLPYGVLDLVVSAADAYGRKGSVRTPVLAIDYSRPREGPLLDFGVDAAASGAAAPVIAVSEARLFTGRFVTPFNGEGIRAVRLEPATAIVGADFEGSVVRVRAKAEGTTTPTTIVVETERGHIFRSGPWSFATDSRPPTVTIVEPAFGSWLRASPVIVVEASDGDRVASVEVSLNGGSPSPLAASGSKFRGTLDSGALEGPVLLELRATDAAGNVSITRTAFIADSKPPAPRRLVPADGDPVTGRTLFVVDTGENPASLASVELGGAGTFDTLEPARVLSFTADIGRVPLVLRLTDKAGNVTETDLLAGLTRTAAPKSLPAPLASIKSNASSTPGALESPFAVFTGTDAVFPGKSPGERLSFTAPMAASTDGPAISASTLPEWSARPIRVSGAATFNAAFTGISPDPKKPVASWGLSPDAASQPLALKADGAGAWTASIKAPVQADGPASIWISVVDTARGTLWTRLALEYDSTPAAITFVSPAPNAGKASAGGAFTLAVRASDRNGIASLSYEAGAEKGEFELEAGSGDGSRTFSFPQKASSMTIVVRALDGSGNRSQTSLAVAYDAAADTPALTFLWPGNGTTAEAVPTGAETTFILHVRDDDISAGAALTLGGAQFKAEGPGPLYAVKAGSPKAGAQASSATAADSGGVQSIKTSVTYTQTGAAPTVRLDAFSRTADSGGGAQGETFVPGSTAVIDGKAALVARIEAPNGLKSVEYALNAGAWASVPAPKPGTDGAYSVRIALPATLNYERNTLAVRVSDLAGGAGTASTSFWRVAPERDQPPVKAEGVYLLDQRIAGDTGATLAPGEVLGALWLGRPVETITLEPPRPFLEVSYDGPSIAIKANAEGGAVKNIAPSILVVRTIDGELFRYTLPRLVVDAGQPVLSIATPLPGSPVGGTVRVEGTAADPNGVLAVEWSMDGGATWTAFQLAAGAGTGTSVFSSTLTLDAGDGPSAIIVRAVDGAGAEGRVLLPLWKDTSAPVLVLESPRAADTVNGTVLVSGYARDGGSVASMEYSADGTTWETVPSYPRNAEAPPEDKTAARDRLVTFSRLIDMGKLPKNGTLMKFRAIDTSGNAGTLSPLATGSPAFVLDSEADMPSTDIQIPAEAEVVRSDLVVSGMAFDDDGIADIFWRLDSAGWTRLEGSNGFAVPFKLLELSDNEHLFEAYSVDLNGVKGKMVSRGFRVSREEPVGMLEAPGVEVTNRGIIGLRGVASDANGIAEVLVSFDSGATYNKAVGTTEWTYTLDTRIVPDGVHSVYVRLVDRYDTPGFAAGLIAVDNTAPDIVLDTPFDGFEALGSITIGGRAGDGVALKGLSLEISKLGASDPEMVVEIASGGVFSRAVDIRKLTPGWYNIKAVATDKASNSSYDSRNIVVLEARKADYAELVFPVHGEHITGGFSIDGRLVSTEEIRKVALTLNGQPFAVVDTSTDGWFSHRVEPGTVTGGELTFRAEAKSSSGTAIASDSRTIHWAADGPWVDIDTITSGSFIVGRPYLTGKAGWDSPEPEGGDKAALEAYKETKKARQVVLVEVSRDNGRTYDKADGTASFKHRLETQEYPNGQLRLIVRATFANGDTAVRKRLVVLDTRPPEITILKPSDNGRYNGVISIEGSAGDENGLADVSVLIRSGDKARYEVPGFIQGSYIDIHLLGATRFETGFGLTFFDDNVKLQLELGQGFDAQPTWENLFGIATADTPAAELSRFGGYVLGARLLANLAYLPFSYWFGPDWDFYSMSFAVGASFTYFSQRSELSMLFSPPDGKFMVLSGVVGQWEFAKFEFGWGVLQSVGFYLEGGLVFIPSEVSTSIEEFIRPNFALGIRIGLF